MKQRNLPDRFNVSHCRIHGRPDSWRSKSNPKICSRSVVGDFSSSQVFPSLLFSLLCVCACIHIYRFTISLIRRLVGVSVDITETRRGIRNRSSHLSQTRPSHDTSRISWDNRFISTPRIPFENGTTDSSGYHAFEMPEKLEKKKIVDINSISIFFFSILFFFVILLWTSENIIRFFSGQF